jgi:hypothetical protein
VDLERSKGRQGKRDSRRERERERNDFNYLIY